MKTPRQLLSQILRFFGLWAGITGGYATVGSACPCCGRPGCPVNFGIAAIFGAIGSFFLLRGRAWLARLRPVAGKIHKENHRRKTATPLLP